MDVEICGNEASGWAVYYNEAGAAGTHRKMRVFVEWGVMMNWFHGKFGPDEMDGSRFDEYLKER